MKTIGIILFALLLLIGEIRCTYKFFTCDFKPSYKAEMIYGFGSFSGLGVIVGYMNIEDTKE